MIADAQAQGKRWKLVCSAERTGAAVTGRVAPEMVSPDSLFLPVDALHRLSNSRRMCWVTCPSQEGSTPDCTAYGLLADFVNAVR